MDLNYILIWAVAFSAGMVLVRAIRTKALAYRGWVIVNGGILVLLAAGLMLFPSLAGIVSGIAWMVFVLLPLLGSRLVWRWAMAQRYSAAWRLAMALAWLHPFEPDRHRPQLLRAMWLAQRGESEEAMHILQRLAAFGGLTGRAAAAQMYRINGRWEELVDWVNSSVGMTGLLRDVGLLLSYLRALGETGDLQRMLWVYAQCGGALEQSGHQPSRDYARMMVLAFCGRTTAVERLLSESLDWLPVTAQEFWRATAETAAGQTEKARQRLTRLLEWETDAVAQAAIARRLAFPLPVASETDIVPFLEEQTEPRPQFRWRAAHATQILIGINVVMFLLETLAGGSTDEHVLYEMGAVSATAVFNGDAWRLLAAMFLHCGWLHLVMNMLGLLLLGPFVEVTLGRLKFMAVYLFSGVASMGFVVVLSWERVIQDDLLVGASGSIMGLVGAMAIIWLRTWRVARSRLALQRLQRVALVIGLQVLFDLMTPQVSMAAHASGVVAGSLAAFLLTAVGE